MSVIRTKKKMKTRRILLLVLIIVGALVIAGAMKPTDVEVSKQNGDINKLALESGNVGNYAIAVDQYVPNSTIVGDVNLDGYITYYDAYLISLHCEGKKITNDQALINADVDGDGSISSKDLGCIKRYMTGETTIIGNITVPTYNVMQKGNTIKLKVYDTTGNDVDLPVEENVKWEVDKNLIATLKSEKNTCEVTLDNTGEIRIQVSFAKTAGESDYSYDFFYIKSIEANNSSIYISGVDNSEKDSNIIGDVNLDGYVTRYDAKLITLHVAGEVITEPNAIKNADVDGDSSIKNRDAIDILTYMDGTSTDIGKITAPLYNQINKDDTVQLKAYDEAGEASDVTWTTTNKSVANVDSSGLVTIKGAGHAIIMAKKGENCDIFRIEGVEVVAEIDGKKYKSLQEAVDACLDSTQKEIIVIKDYTLKKSLTISEQKNIILNLNNKKIQQYISNYGHLVIKEGTVGSESFEADGSLVDNCSTGNLTLENANLKVKNNLDGLIFNEGTLNIKSGTVEVCENGIAIVNHGDLTVGTNEQVGNTETLKIIGRNDSVGISHNNGKSFTFYSGEVKGTGKAISNLANVSCPSGYFVKTTQEIENGVTYYVSTVTNNAVASITRAGIETKYGSLEDALENAKDRDTIKLLNNIEEKSKIKIDCDEHPYSITLDLNGKKIENISDNGATLEVYNDLKITDNTYSKEGIIKGPNGIDVYRGTLTLENGKIEGINENGVNLKGDSFNGPAGMIIVNGGTIIGQRNWNSRKIC